MIIMRTNLPVLTKKKIAAFFIKGGPGYHKVLPHTFAKYKTVEVNANILLYESLFTIGSFKNQPK